MTPHLCPKCQGERVVPDRFQETTSAFPSTRQCPTCKGEGVLWGPHEVPRHEGEPYIDPEPLDFRKEPRFDNARERPYWDDLPKTYCEGNTTLRPYNTYWGDFPGSSISFGIGDTFTPTTGAT